MTTTLVPAAQVVAQPDLAAAPPAQLPITRSDVPSDGQGAQFAQLPAGPFDIVYADPPWHYYGSLRARLGDNRWIGPRLRHEAEPLRLNCELVGFLAPQDQHDLLRESAAVLGGALAPPSSSLRLVEVLHVLGERVGD